METSQQPTFRIPIILLALSNLVILGARVWPWQEVMNLPGNGTTAFDPAITMAAYIGLGIWIGNVRTDAERKSLYIGALLGLLAGLFLVIQALLQAHQASEGGDGIDNLQSGLMAAATMIIGTVGLRTARAGNNMGFSTVCAIWASMVSCLMVSLTVLAVNYFAAGAAESPDPWQQYAGIADSTPAIQALVRSLDTTSAFLLVGPIIGGIVGALFAAAGKTRKA